MTTTEITLRPGMTVRDEFGAWTLKRDEDGWFAVQGLCEVLLLDHGSLRRFGIEGARLS